MKKIQLGKKVRCKVTGFTGTAIGRLEHLNGCVQYAVKPPMPEGENKMPEGVFLDEEQLEVLPAKKAPVKKSKTGGDYSLCKAARI